MSACIGHHEGCNTQQRLLRTATWKMALAASQEVDVQWDENGGTLGGI